MKPNKFLQSEHFSFLAISEMRSRSMFYTSLGRLLMVDLGEDEERFYNFMLPLTSNIILQFKLIQGNFYGNLIYFACTDSFQSIGSIIMDTNSYPNEEAKKALIGLARDLRGLACASSNRSSYMMFFDWM